MARGTPLVQLVEMVRDECGLSSNSSRGIDNGPYITRLIKRYYETLADDFDWPFMRVDKAAATKALAAGQRFYDFPVAMDLLDTIECETYIGGSWLPVSYGISGEEYSAFNSDNSTGRAEPVLAWQIKDGDQFEVWPIPTSDGEWDRDADPPVQTAPLVRFTGRRRITPLVESASLCDMDDQLVVLYVAAEILGKQGSKDAPIKLAAAKDRLATLRGRSTDRRKVRIGLGAGNGNNPRLGTIQLAYRSNPASN
jgi:hypothetical protein